MEHYTVKLTSLSPMLMHADILSNPLHPATKAHKKLTSDRTFKKTDEGLIAIAKSEYINSLYMDKKGKVCLPTMNIRASLIQGARLSRGGKEVERAVVFMDQQVPLVYDGPKTAEGLWKDKTFVDQRTVRVQRAKLVRYRPIFTEWEAITSVTINPELLNIENLLDYWKMAGNLVGIGDFRPLFGRYEVELVD